MTIYIKNSLYDVNWLNSAAFSTILVEFNPKRAAVTVSTQKADCHEYLKSLEGQAASNFVLFLQVACQVFYKFC